MENDNSRPVRWRNYFAWGFAGLMLYFYVYSFLTLPFANKVWLGELPPLALVQLPKSMLKHRIQEFLISLLPRFGLASGSPSPDMILTSPWALGLAVTLPALVILPIAWLTLPRGKSRRLLLIALVLAMILDGVVTFWFDATSSLSIF